MRLCEGYNYVPKAKNVFKSEALQVIDHGYRLVYNREDQQTSSMLQNPDNNMNTNKQDSGRKPHPSASDPLEARIRGLIREQAQSTLNGVQMWQKTKELQRDYFKDAAAHMEDSAYIHDATQKVLNDIAVATNTQIVSGKENISDIKTPALVVLNHYSGYKLTSLKSDDLEIDFGKMEELYPFPSFFASMIPVARGIGQDVTLHDAHLEYGRKEDDSLLRKIQEKAGLLVISEENGGFKDTLDATRQIIDKNPKSLIVVFPEGESSGKRNEGGPYDMVAFHTGAFVIAGELGLPVIPAVQYFNPDTGFQVVVLPPIESRVFEKGPDGKPTAESKEYYEKLAQETHDKMQYELDRLMGKVA